MGPRAGGGTRLMRKGRSGGGELLMGAGIFSYYETFPNGGKCGKKKAPGEIPVKMSQGKIKGAKGARDAASVTNPACGAPWTLVKYQQDAAMLQELPARERAAVCHDCGRYFFIFLVLLRTSE